MTNIKDRFIDYTIHRECWNDLTFNGYVDNPYWRVVFENYSVLLSDDGTYLISDPYDERHDPNPFVEEALKHIIKECKLNIELQKM